MDANLLLHTGFVLASVFLLWGGANWIVESAAAIARSFKISELVIGLSVVAMGTSAPEFLVSATAAFKGHADISLANIVGSNIFNLGLILGLMAVISPVKTHRTLVFRDGAILWLVTILVLVFAMSRSMGRTAGSILICCLIVYMAFIIFRAPKPLANLELPDQRKSTWKDYPLLLSGFAAIAVGGHLMVEGASFLARQMGVSEWAIGVTIVAAGTSLPELVTCLAASIKGKSDMLLGNLLGSDFFNFAGVLGMTCLLHPLNVSPSSLSSLYALVIMVFLVLVFMRTGWRVSRGEGLFLLAVNLGRWVLDFTQ